MKKMSPKKKKRATWTTATMENAMKALDEGYSQRQVELKFNIPRRTLRNHIKSGNRTRKLGRSTILVEDQENDLVTRIIQHAEVGLPMTPFSIRSSAFTYCENNRIPHNFNKSLKLAGKKWYLKFMKKHPNLSRRKAQHMNMARVAKLNRFIVDDYFKKLSNVYDKLNLWSEPHKIYNMDEKGCRLTIHHQQTVIAEKGVKRVHLIANEHAENVTVVACCSAVGQFVPPMILFKGQKMKETYIDNMPPKTTIGMTKKGSMTVEMYNNFLDHFNQFKVPGNVLLIFDGAKCHCDLSIVEKAERYGIHLFMLPSNTTHELQPLDKAVFKSFETFWDTELLTFWKNFPDRKMNKERFGIVFTKVWKKCMTMSNCMSGFEATGIYPYDPSIIPISAFAPSSLTEIQDQETIAEADEQTVDDPAPITNASTSSKTVDDPAPKTNASTSSKNLEVSINEKTTKKSKKIKKTVDNTVTPETTSVKIATNLATTSAPIATNSLVLDETEPVASTSSVETSSNEKNKDIGNKKGSTGKKISPPFRTVLPSPSLKTTSAKKLNRKKALNYKAVSLSKNLFPPNDRRKTTDAKIGEKKKP